MNEDINEKRASEERLHTSETQFRILVQGVADYAVYMLDPEGHVSSWNPGAERIKGYLNLAARNSGAKRFPVLFLCIRDSFKDQIDPLLRDILTVHDRVIGKCTQAVGRSGVPNRR